MKLNFDGVWTISSNHLKILTAVEICTKKHLIVPIDLLKEVAKVKCNFLSFLKDLCKNKFLVYEKMPYEGYRLTYSGHDCLAINALRKKGLKLMGDKVGIGKESDIYIGVYKDKEVILKFHRLGRTSFRTVTNNRDYNTKGSHTSWMNLSKLSSEKEFEYLKLFSSLNVPVVLDCNRHVVVMEYLKGYVPLYQAKEINLDKVYFSLIKFIEEFHELGYVHGDFNEFNVMVNDESDVVVIDFPQCVKINNERATEYLKRDIECVKKYFLKKYRYVNESEINIEVKHI